MPCFVMITPHETIAALIRVQSFAVQTTAFPAQEGSTANSEGKHNCAAISLDMKTFIGGKQQESLGSIDALLTCGLFLL